MVYIVYIPPTEFPLHMEWVECAAAWITGEILNSIYRGDPKLQEATWSKLNWEKAQTTLLRPDNCFSVDTSISFKWWIRLLRGTGSPLLRAVLNGNGVGIQHEHEQDLSPAYSGNSPPVPQRCAAEGQKNTSHKSVKEVWFGTCLV